MTTKHILHRLLQLALLDIRHEAQNEADVKKIAVLSDLFHNLPLALLQDGVNYDELLTDLTERASHNKGLSAWLSSNSQTSK